MLTCWQVPEQVPEQVFWYLLVSALSCPHMCKFCDMPTYCGVGMLSWHFERVLHLKAALFGKGTTLVRKQVLDPNAPAHLGNHPREAPTGNKASEGRCSSSFFQSQSPKRP